MILISPQTAENLYWMGRYIQRAESMTRLIIQLFDKIVDENFDEGKELYERLGIALNYKTSEAFLHKSVFELEYVSLHYVINSARENAVLTRSHLPNRMFSRINALYLKYQQAKEDSLASIFWLESTLYELDAIWGNLELSLVESKESSIIELGKIIERMDLNIRIFDSIEAALLDVEKLNIIAHKVCPKCETIRLSTSNKAKVLHTINSVIRSVVATN